MLGRYVYFNIMHGECRLKIDTETSELVSWSPDRVTLDEIVAAVQERTDDQWYDWRAWVACRDVVQKRVDGESVREKGEEG